MNQPNPPKILKNVSPLLNGKFDLVSLSRDTAKSERLSSKTDYLVVLPFDRTEDGKVKSVYCVKADDPVTDAASVTLLIDAVDKDKDTTPFDSVTRALLEEAGLNIEELGITEDDMFYIGNLSTTEPAYAKFRCYAVDLTKISRPDVPIEFARTLSKSAFTKDSSEIVKVGFHQIVNGDYTDVSILAGTFLLISYFSI